MKKKYTSLIVIFLIVATFIAYARILGNGFVNFDDGQYITKNNHIQAGLNSATIKWAFSAVVSSNWHPLTLLSHALDWSLFGANASGHHLVNLLLHIGSVLFLFFFLEKTTKSLWPSAFVATLFALHPLRVESVAWAAERKDVLSMFFGMATLYVYALYVEEQKLARYFLCLMLFALGLMAKPMLVTLPFVLMLLDFWPLGRWPKALAPVKVPAAVSGRLEKKKTKQRRTDSAKEKKISTPLTSSSSTIRSLLWEKAPFIFLTIVSSIMTIWAQNKGGALVSVQKLPFAERVVNAIISYVSYLGKIFWPVDLAVFYPYEDPFLQLPVSGALLILIGITIVVIYTIKKLPFLFVGWFWYLGTLIPVIGLVQVGSQAMADRYTYLPSIGIGIMLIWGIVYLLPREKLRKIILIPAAATILSVLTFLTWQQCGYWKNSIELFSHALHITKDNDLAHNDLGLALFEEGKNEEAIDHYNEAIRITPNHNIPYNNRGNAYAKLGQYHRAIENYNQAIRLKQDYVDAYYNRGNAYNNLGQYQRAIEDYDKAIGLNPNYIKAYYNRGAAYAELGQFQLAIEEFNKAIRLKPDYTLAYNSRATVYLIQGNNKLGCSDAQKACALGVCKALEGAKGKGLCR
jgi:Flp pilus assembly protein TadD